MRNSFYVISRILTSNLATEVRVGPIDAEWTTEHTCFDGIPIERTARLYEALTGFHWDNPCMMFLQCMEIFFINQKNVEKI